MLLKFDIINSDVNTTLGLSNVINEVGVATQPMTEVEVQEINRLARVASELFSDNMIRARITAPANIRASFVVKQWLQSILDLDIGIETLNIHALRNSYTQANADGVRTNHSTLDEVVYGRTRGSAGQLYIRLLHVTRGMDCIDALHENMTSTNTFQRSVSLALTEDTRHKINVYYDADRNILDIVSNRPTFNKLNKVLAAITTLLPGAREKLLADTPTDQAKDLNEFCSILYEEKINEYLAYVDAQSARVEERLRERRVQALNSLVKHISTGEVTMLEKQKARLMSNITDYERTLASMYNDLTKANRDIMSLAIGNETQGQEINAFVKFITEHPEIIELQSNQGEDMSLYCKITTPITNYRRKDAEMYFKRSEPNYITDRPAVAKLFKACFIDETYQMVCSTNVRIRFNDNSNDLVRGLTNNPGHRGNIHIAHYNCFSSTKSEITKCKAERRYLDMLMYLIQACATYTLTDSSVMSRLAGEMYNDLNTIKMYRKMGTTTLLTGNEVLKQLEEVSE